MKRRGHLIELIADPANIRLAACKAAKGKSNAPEVRNYFLQLDNEVLRLHSALIEGNLKLNGFKYFYIYDPKLRLISKPAFRDQVLHHAMINIIGSDFEKYQIYHSYACRKGKGTHSCVIKAAQNHQKFKWYLKLDVQKFFYSIDHNVVIKQLNSMFKDAALLQLFLKILGGYEFAPGKGLPLGSLISQYLANHYLASCDHFILNKIKPKAYVRYMDDFVLWFDQYHIGVSAASSIAEYVSQNLRCNLKISQLQPTSNPMGFLGYTLYSSGLELSSKSRKKLQKNLAELQEQYDLDNVEEELARKQYTSFVARSQFIQEQHRWD
jgi:RNA-directed DNA polymerase